MDYLAQARATRGGMATLGVGNAALRSGAAVAGGAATAYTLGAAGQSGSRRRHQNDIARRIPMLLRRHRQRQRDGRR